MRLDFLHPAPQRPGLAWVVLVLGLLCLGAVGWRYLAAQERLTELAQARARVAIEAAPIKVVAQDTLTRQPRLGLRVLGRLEAMRPDDVALLSLQFEGASGELNLLAESPTSGAMLDFLARLQALPETRSVSLQRHTLVEPGVSERVRYGLFIRWQP